MTKKQTETKPRCHDCGSDEIVGSVRDCVVGAGPYGTIRSEPVGDPRYYCAAHPTEPIEHRMSIMCLGTHA